MTRLLFNKLVSGIANQNAQRWGKDHHHRDGRKLLEELWVLSGNLLMVGAASFVMLKRNGGCGMLSSELCLAGWPNHHIATVSKAYYAFESAWYVHLLLKPVLKYGIADGRDITMHHIASLTLLVAGAGFQLQRMGIKILFLFAISNPALHAAKIVNQLDIVHLKVLSFGYFALLFFVTRIVLVPICILWPALRGSWHWIPYAIEDFFPAYVGFNALLLLLYGLQLIWMRSIFRVLVQALVSGADEASKLSAHVDPAKRYSEITKTANEKSNGNFRQRVNETQSIRNGR